MMVRGRKSRKYNTCQDCGVEFLRWRRKDGNWTAAQYCPQCKTKRQGAISKVPFNVIVEARRNNPCATLQEISNHFGISRERVRQILSLAEEPTSAWHQTYLCIQCGKEIKGHGKLFCGRRCLHDYTHMQIACSYCGKLREYNISILVSRLKHKRHSSDLFFCSKQCQGSWLAEKHGFPAHPENRVRAGARKWDYSKIYKLREKTGWGGRRIGRALGIPHVTVDVILRKSRKPPQCGRCGGKLFSHTDGLQCFTCGGIVYLGEKAGVS